MCGLVGWVDLSQQSPNISVLENMASTISHRGPDGAGLWIGHSRDDAFQIALGHRRLAIIDPEGGYQPMVEPDGSIILVFNGEIYNFPDLKKELQSLGYEFRTNSDTEVLIKSYLAWGEECVSRFRGMFAFALWDKRTQRLFLARDRFGKKPFYWYRDGQRLIFASEIKAILAHPAIQAELDRQSVWDYLGYRYVPGPFTLFKNIHKLPPASFALWQEGRVSVQNYYTPPDASPIEIDESIADPVQSFADKLDECVRIRMISDVPFGAFLSGGLDSSAVVAIMSRYSPYPVKTFSIGYREANYSELRYAAQVADSFGTDHHEVEISAHDMMDWLPKLIHYRDAPVAEPADIPIYLLSVEAGRTVKMVLTGEGSDEFLGGYPKHRVESMVASYQKLIPEAVHRHLISPMVAALPYPFRRIKTVAASFALRDPLERWPRWFGALDPDQRAILADCLAEEESRAVDERPFGSSPEQSPLRRILHFDQTSWLPDNLLERGDRMTMAASIEARMPFMDHELAELVARLPDSCRIFGSRQKWILRRAMQNILPKDILNRPKVGFRVPVNEWFRGPMRNFISDHLLGGESLTRDYYRRSELERILNEHFSAHQNHEKLIWMLMGLELFQRHYALR